MADTTPLARRGTDESDLSGRQLGDYRLLRRLGRGAMAAVYLAEQCSLRRQVALKVLRDDLSADESYVKRFHFEAQAAAALVHSNIVQIYEVGCADGVHFIAQEYVQGLNLAEVLQRRGSPELKQVVSVIRQVAAALQRAGQRGIVHRDIKPENIMLSLGGEVKVADFGLARLNDDTVKTNLTQAGFTMGTPLYMSPEQVEGKPLDQRSDLYSLGVTCYRMLAGQEPFQGETALGVAVQHLKSQPERLETLRPDLPAPLCRMVHKLLAKSPDQRYPSAREFLLELRSLHVPGLESEPAVDLEGLVDEQAETVRTRRLAATQQLQSLMATSALRTAKVRAWKRLLAGSVIAAVVIGAGAAWLRRDRPLLPSDDDPAIPVRKDTAQAQYEFARELDTEAAWKSVTTYFPGEKNWAARSQRELGQWYLQHEQLDQALATFVSLAELSNVDRRYRAEGLLGQAEVHSRQDAPQKLERVLDDLLREENSLRPVPSGTERISQLLALHRDKLPAETVRAWDEWLAGRSPR